jgi:hypothetical protein
MRVDEFILELLVELSSYLDAFLVFGGEGCGDGDVGYFFVGGGLLGAFLGEAFGRDDVGGGEGG